MSKHTPGPWRQGFTMVTNTTKRWSAKQFAANQQREQRSVYANFSANDRGCGRKLIAVCESPDDAAIVAVAPDLLEALEHMLNVCPAIDSSGEEARGKALAIVARAKGETVIAKASTAPANDCWFCNGTKEYQGQPCLICVEQKP